MEGSRVVKGTSDQIFGGNPDYDLAFAHVYAFQVFGI